MKKTIKLNAILNTIKQVCSLLFPLITFPYALRVLGIENYGKINFSSSIIVYFSLLAALGIQTYAVREGARVREDKRKFEDFANQIFSINILTTIMTYILLFVTVVCWEKLWNYKWLLMIQSFIIIFATLGCEWVNVIYEDYLYITLRYILLQIICVIAMFLFVKDVKDYAIYACITTFAQAGAGLVNIFYIRRYVHLKFRFTNLEFVKHIKPLVILFGVTLSSYVYINSDITMLGIFHDDIQVGIYSTGTKVYMMVKQLLCAIIVVAVPRVSVFLGRKDYCAYNQLLKTIFETTLLIVLPMATGLAIKSVQIVSLIGGAEAIQSSAVVSILSVALIPAVLAYFFSTAILVPNRLEKYFLQATILGAGVNVILNLVLIPQIGIYGAAITTVLSEVLVLFVTAMAARKCHDKLLYVRTLVAIIAGCICIVLVCYLVDRFISNSFCNLLVSIVLSGVTYVVCIAIGNKKLFNGMIKEFAKKNKCNKEGF